jgi:hypothetical protein
MITVQSDAAMADDTSSVPLNSSYKFAVGAGYERYTAEWIGSNHSKGREVSQNRLFLQMDYQPVRCLRVGAGVGGSDLSAPELATSGYCDFGFCDQLEYPVSPFASVNINWTPLGALPGSRGASIEILFEVSAFSTFASDKIDGTYLDWGGEVRRYEAWPEVRSMWEGKLGFLLATQHGSWRFGAGLMYLESGAEARTRIKTDWYDGNETDYLKTRNNIGMLLAWQFSPVAAIVIDAEAVWTMGGPQLKISLERIMIL